jgi:hypothetical protein
MTVVRHEDHEVVVGGALEQSSQTFVELLIYGTRLLGNWCVFELVITWVKRAYVLHKAVLDPIGGDVDQHA